MDMADEFFLTILGRLNEAQARWYVAREALALGRGGISCRWDEKLARNGEFWVTLGIAEPKQKRSCHLMP